MAKSSRRVTAADPTQRRAPASPTRSRQAPPAAGDARSPYPEAVGLYEQALKALQARQYLAARDLLRDLVARFPQERELVERSRLYLALCERQIEPPATEPGNVQERLYAATLALNAGDPGGAIGHLTRALADDPGNDRALYLLAVAHSDRGETRVAIPYLEQAIAANPENRTLARTDPDLAALRADSAVTALLGAPGGRASRR